MSKALYAVINPVVKFILASPLHGLMSHNTMLLEFTGRKSGKRYSTPVSYHATETGPIHCFTARENKWWRNLQDGGDVQLTLRGRRLVGKPTVLADGSEPMQAALRDLLIATPRDASHSGVAFDADGKPVASDVADATQRLAFISIEVSD